MTDIVLHHYESSPYSEKVRLGLGLKGLAWASVEVPQIMPKPDLTALTGGYRKTPVSHPELLSRRPRRGRCACLVGREDNVQPGGQRQVREEIRHVAQGISRRPG